MISAEQQMRRRPAGRGFVLLVLVVLAGVLGMHALSPSPLPTHRAGADHARAGRAAAQVAAPDEDRACSHTAGGSGHLNHADATCVAAGIGSAYAPPALAAAVADAATAPGPADAELRATVSGRAPPDLAELQLLRI
jgi:hypothetical protein